MGFDSYSDYLKSDLWKSIRERVFFEKTKICSCCGGKANQVHHTRYDTRTLTGECLDKLHPICSGCHLKIEFDDLGLKRTLKEANKILCKSTRWWSYKATNGRRSPHTQ